MAQISCHLLPTRLVLLISLSVPFFYTISAATVPRLASNPVNRIYECVSDGECPSHQYCDVEPDDWYADYYLSNLGMCLPQVGESEACKTYTDQFEDSYVSNCRDGLRCAKVKGKGTICVRRSGKGKKCDPEETFICGEGLICSKKKKRCIVDDIGLLGSKCDPYDDQCKESMGLYCKDERGDGNYGTCQKKKSHGMECDPNKDKECYGFCVSIDSGNTPKSICLKKRELGQLCKNNRECTTAWRNGTKPKQILCNKGDEFNGFLPRYGVCALEKNLIKAVGRECDPKMNLCDFRRDMTCESVEGKFVCVQKGGRMRWRHLQDDMVYRHCTPGSKYSTCPGQECRRLTRRIPKTPYGSYFCLEPRVVLKRGGICSMEEYAQCEEGTECVEAPGVRNEIAKPLGYCMKRVGKGSNCSDRFKTTCAQALFCRKGKCDTRESKIKTLYAGIYVSCSSKRPCALGLVCKNEQCDLVLSAVTAKLGETCENTLTQEKNCEKGTTCDGFVDILRCRKDWGSTSLEGDLCSSETPCKKGLKCSATKLYIEPKYNTDYYSMCYSPLRSLPQGAECHVDETDVSPISRFPPGRGAPLPECYIPKSGNRVTKCLRKGKSLVCQVEATLFEYCSEKENIACEKGLVCGRISVCVGPNEE